MGLALTKQLQYAIEYGHLFAQFYGRNAKPTEFGFIVGDYIVYRLFSVSLYGIRSLTADEKKDTTRIETFFRF